MQGTNQLTTRQHGADARPRRRRGPAGRSAFTLIELLLVLVILAVLAAVVVPKFTGRSDDARIAAAKTDIANMGTALDAFEVDNGRYPATDEGIQALVTQPQNAPKWKQYLQQMKSDPWGHPYQYRYPGQNNPSGYDLWSWGKDGRDGGGDDIDNWTQTSSQ
jgi:general secretion pathway protein G